MLISHQVSLVAGVDDRHVVVRVVDLVAPVLGDAMDLGVGDEDALRRETFQLVARVIRLRRWRACPSPVGTVGHRVSQTVEVARV